MTSKLYIAKVGGGTIDLTGFTGRKGTPFFDQNQSLIQLGMRFANGEASQGTFRVMDPDAEIPRSDFAYNLPAHKLVTWTEDASGTEIWLARGRTSVYDGGRGVVLVDNEVEYDVTVDDGNIELRGQAFTEPWVRPEETDVARIVALQAYTLNGSSSTATHHRDTCEVTVDTTHLVASTPTVTMPAKTYPYGTQPQDVIQDCADTAERVYGVVIHHTGGSHLCLLYCAEGDYSYTTAVRISDHVDEWDPDHATAPVLEPHWDQGKASLYDGQQLLSGLISTYGTDAAVFVEHTANIDSYDYWVDSYSDAVSTSLAQATLRAGGILGYRRLTHVTHRVSVVLAPEQVHLLGTGMAIEVKAAAMIGGQYLDTWQTRRIAECSFEPRPDGMYWAHLNLDRAQKRVGYSQGRIPVARPPRPSTPEVVTGYEFWSWELDPAIEPIVHLAPGATDGAFVNDTTTDDTSFGTNEPYITAGAVDGRYYKTGGLGGSTESGFIVATPDTVYRVSGYYGYNTTDWGQTPGSARVQFYSGTYGSETILSTTTVGGGAGNEKVWESFSDDVTAPTGTTMMQVLMNVGGSGSSWDAISIAVITPAVAGDDPAIIIGGPGEGEVGDGTPVTIPIGTVIEHGDLSGKGGTMHDATQVEISDAGGYFTGTDVETALQELGAGSTSGHSSEAMAVPPWVVPSGSGQITMAPETRITVDSGAGYKAFPGMCLARGVLHLVYRKGTNHITTTDGTIEYRTSTDLGQTWGAATTIHNPTDDARNPGILYHSSGRLVVCFETSPVSAGTGRTTWSMYSDDLGQSWSTPVEITDDGYDSLPSTSGSPIELPDGTILQGMFGKFTGDTEYSASVVFSTDRGATFGSPVTIADGGAAARWYHEPVLKLCSDGSIVALIRSNTTEHTYRSVSTDGGQTWSAVADVLTAAGRVDFVEFYPGALLAFCRNDGTDNDSRYATSWDYGVTWTALAETDTGVTQNQEYAAPVVLAPGLVFTVYGLETSSTDSDLYGRYFFDGYGTDVLGRLRTKYLQMPETTAPSTPSSGQGVFYVNSSGVPHFINDAGTDTDLTSGTVTAADVRDAGRWEVVISGNPATAVTTEDGTDWVYGWVSG